MSEVEERIKSIIETIRANSMQPPRKSFYNLCKPTIEVLSMYAIGVKTFGYGRKSGPVRKLQKH